MSVAEEQPAIQPPATNSKSKEGRAKHQCGQCQSTFTRTEHLKRHEMMHNRSRPYSCGFCGKAFGRSDVVNRHIQTCKVAQNAGTAASEAAQRVSRACISCRQSKVKCSGGQPCDRCCSLDRHRECCFTLLKSRVPHATSAVVPQVVALNDEELPVFVPSQPQFDDTIVMAKMDQRGSVPDNAMLDMTVFEEASGLQDAGVPGPTTIDPNTFDTPTLVDTLPDFSTDAYLDLDLMDWSILDNVLDTQADPIRFDVGIDDAFLSPVTTTDKSRGSLGELELPAAELPLPTGIDLIQISPLDAHRSNILAFLRDQNELSHRRDQFFVGANISMCLRSYFNSFHQHTPLLHLPTWNIATISSRLVFSMILMGAIYSGQFEPRSSEIRNLCLLAESYAWKSDKVYTSGKAAQLDTIQAVYLATLLRVFYLPSRPNRQSIDFRKIIDEARRARLFERNTTMIVRWEDWAAQESRIRTAFILYLFDAILAIYFNKRPELHSFELQLPLPSDESLFVASTSGLWEKLSTAEDPVSKIDYSVILSLFLCHKPVDAPLRFSVMGAFIVLHGILLHTWERKHSDQCVSTVEKPDDIEAYLRTHLSDTRKKIIDGALHNWRRHWTRTVARPGSISSKGLYRDRALAYWIMGNVLNYHNTVIGSDIAHASTDGNWTLKVPRMLKTVAAMMDAGQLTEKDELMVQQLSKSLETSTQMVPGSNDAVDDTETEDMDTIILGCIMRKDRQTT